MSQFGSLNSFCISYRCWGAERVFSEQLWVTGPALVQERWSRKYLAKGAGSSHERWWIQGKDNILVSIMIMVMVGVVFALVDLMM